MFPKVLWVADTPRRGGLIRKAIGRARSLHHDLFDVTTTDEAVTMLGGGQ